MPFSFRDFIESDSYPSRNPSRTNSRGDETDHTGGINYELGVTDQDQMDVGPYVGSGIQAGTQVYAGLPSFQVLSMNSKFVKLRINDVGNKVLDRRKGENDVLNSDPSKQNGRIVVIPRWQYERMITRAFNQDQGGGMAPLPPGTDIMQ